MAAPGTAERPHALRVDRLGGDVFGRGDQPALSWQLPPRARSQQAYRITTDDGYDTGWVDSAEQTYRPLDLPHDSRRVSDVRVQVRTDRGESPWSAAVSVHSGVFSEADWSATWIGVEEPARAPKGERPAYWLRSTFDGPTAAGAAETGRLYVTALGMVELYLNGTRVGDVELAPGFMQYRDRVPYLTLDVGELLRPGPNVVCALLADGWFRGQVGMPRAADQFGTDLALRLQIETPVDDRWTPIATTGEGWRTSTSHVLAADLIGGQREDRRLVDPSVHDPAYGAGDWSPAVRREVTAAVVRPVAPPIRRVQEVRPVAVHPLADGAFIVDLGQNINGWTRLTSLGPQGTSLTLRHGEHLDHDGDLTTRHLDVDVPIFPEALPVGQVDAVTSSGRPGDAFEPRFTTHGFRYMRLEGHPGPLSADDVMGVVVHTDLRRTGWFACSDDRLNRFHDAVVWSLRGNVCGLPTDCPQRERAGWTGDWQVFAPTAAYLYDVLAFTRDWLRDVALDQRADGCVANLAPCPPVEGFAGPVGFLNGSAGWGDVVVSASWDLYQAYGDVSLLRETWTSARAWVDYAAEAAAAGRHPARATGRPEPAPHEKYLWDTGFHWGEWLEPGFEIDDFGAFAGADKSEVATAYLHRSADQLARIGEVIGADPATITHYRDLAAGAQTAWRAEFLDADGRLVTQSQAAHVRALAFGLIPAERRAAAAERLVELVAEAGDHLSTGFLSTGLLLGVLADAGHPDTAYALLFQDTEPSWLTMIDRGGTTVWERWNGVDADGVAHESLNHYSKGAVASFLHRTVAGLRPTSPGYRTFLVAPQPGGGLTWAEATLESPYGRIAVSWKRDGERLTVAVTVPPGTTATVQIPGGAAYEIGPGEHTWTA